jgi:hypothetical protein
MAKKAPANRYARIIERIFFANYREGATAVTFERSDLERAAKEVRVKLPKNLGDVIYSFRFRAAFPPSVLAKAPAGQTWMIRLIGRARYCIAASPVTLIEPRQGLTETKIPDATPGIIERYALSDEQALLAKLRYNRLVDVFTGITCYSLQSHLRTTVVGVGQVETDEIYIGLDRRGAHFVFPVQAKGGKDKQNVVQVEQDWALCREKFPNLICRPIAAQFIRHDLIALFEFVHLEGCVTISAEKHYRLVPQEEISPEDLRAYQTCSRDA